MSPINVHSGLGASLAPWLQRQLRQLLQQRGHALLLSGPSGLGQYSLALALTRAWLCLQPTPDGACGRCSSCHAVDVRTHPDLLVLMPESLAIEHQWPLDAKAQKEIDEKRKPSRWIKVEAARQAVAFTQFTRSGGSTKLVLICPADRLNVESANTLLKTLEEPTGAVRFVLATEALHQLAPTVLSRCQQHPLVWPEEQEALDWLAAQSHAWPSGGPPERANCQVCLKAAGGRPDDALAWAQLGLNAALWHGLPKALAGGDWRGLSAWPPALQLKLLQQLCHDLMARAAGGQPRYFDAADLGRTPPWAVLARWSTQLLQATRSVEHPFNAGLMQEAWAAQTRQILSA